MSEVDALINLLQDEDPHIAVIAMEKLLATPSFIDNQLKDLQESADPCLRSRVHQMESIISRQRRINDFTERVKDNKIELWEDLIFLNKIIDRDLTSEKVTEAYDEIVEKVSKESLSTLELAAFMRENTFNVPSEDILDPSLFLIYEVLASGLGTPLLLCIVTQKIGKLYNKNLTIVLHKGRHCLVDEHNSFIDPQNSWSVTKLKMNAKVYPCTNRDILLTLISQLYLSALLEGQLRVISFLSKVVAALSNSSLEDLPFPIGNAEK